MILKRLKKNISLKNEVKIDKIKINLIFFYEGKSQENVNIYNKLKLEVLGGFFGVQKVDILIKLLSRLEGLNTSFTLISTGSSFQKVEKFCCKLNCIQQIIIYCFDLDKYNSLYIQNNRVNLISNQISDINLYLKTKSILFPEYDIIFHGLKLSIFLSLKRERGVVIREFNFSK